jgi:hypothetical protein
MRRRVGGGAAQAGVARRLSLLLLAASLLVMPSSVWAGVRIGVDGSIFALAHRGGTVYAGGAFDAIGTFTGSAMAVSPVTGAPLWRASPLDVNEGALLSDAVADGEGGFWVLENQATIRHVTAAGVLDPGWSWSLGFLAEDLVRSGNVLIADAGADPAGTPVVAIATTPEPAVVWTTHVSGEVYGLAATDSRVFVAGRFDAVGSVARSDLAALDAADGSVVVGFDSQLDGTATAVALDPAGTTVYVAGEFATVNGSARNGLAAVASADGALVAGFVPPAVHSDAPTDHGVFEMVVDADRVYASGVFSDVGGAPRAGFAAFSRADGTLTPLALPTVPEAGIQQVALAGGRLYVVGFFQRIAGVARENAAAIDPATGTVAEWAPEPRGHPDVLAAGADAVFLSGDFTVMGGVARGSLAAFDARTGSVTPFDVPVDGSVYQLAVRGSTLYLAGDFHHVGNARRPYLASVNLSTGRVTSWKPRPNGPVNAIALAHGRLFAGGAFERAGHRARDGFAAFSLATGRLQGLRVSVQVFGGEHEVTGLAVAGHTLYLGGSFERVNGVSRTNLAAVDTATGRVLPFAAPANGAVWGIVPTHHAVYIAGGFTRFGATRRRTVAALDPVDGSVLRWNPLRHRGQVTRIARAGKALYLAGVFQPLAAGLSNNIALVDTRAGRPRQWAPTHLDATQGILALLAIGRTVFAAGPGWWATLPAG